jgi:capsular exopolysaccharide synthesis family protein
MTFERYYSILQKQWKLLVLCTVIVTLGTYVGSRLTTPIFQSSVLIRVAISSSNSSADYNSLLASDQLVQTEAQIALSDPILHNVASHYSGLTVDQLAKVTTSTPKLNTQLFEIDVQDPIPTRAAAIANDIANTLIQQQVQEIQQNDNISQQQLQQEMDATRHDIDATTSKIAALQTQITSMEVQRVAISQISALQIQMNNLQSQLDSSQARYNQWQTTLAQLQMTEAQNNSFLRLVQPAQPAKNPVRPQILLNTALGLATGLLLGLIMAALVEQLDTRIRTQEEISELLNLPVLGTVWKKNTSKKEQEDLFNPQGRNINAESYRILRTNIGFSSINRPVRSLMITSAMPQDGKSTIAANLAIFMAKAGKNTLLIDADLRRPTQHQRFLLSAKNDLPGLSDAIMAFAQSQSFPANLNKTIKFNGISLNNYMHATDIANLWVMPAGQIPPNPSELLDSKAASSLFNTITQSGVDMIIFDTPPLLGLSDASILLPKVDGTLLVINAMSTKRKNLRQMKTILSQVDSHVLGCILNKLRPDRRETAYYYYYRSDEEKVAPGGPQSPLASSPSPISSATRKNGTN